MTKLRLPDGAEIPTLGQGTWHRGKRGARRAEEVVAEAIAGRREEVLLVSKAYPQNAGGRKLEAAGERSLRWRLSCDETENREMSVPSG
jgi:diketogulonate reductase-like aldo/keto reductase